MFRIAGISGIVDGAISFSQDSRWRWLFIAGLLIGGWLYEGSIASQPTPTSEPAPVSTIVGGLLVGFRTRLGNGCTSGHGTFGLLPWPRNDGTSARKLEPSAVCAGASCLACSPFSSMKLVGSSFTKFLAFIIYLPLTKLGDFYHAISPTL